MRFLRGLSLTPHHGKYVRALHAEDEPCLPVPVTKVFGFLASVELDARYGVDQVAVGVSVTRDALHFSSGSLPTILYSCDVVLDQSSSI